MENRNTAGFTILETLIALAIMTVAFASILMVQSGSINAIEKSRIMNTVTMLAKKTMVETETKLEGRGFKEMSKSEAGAFKPPYEDYAWERTIAEVEFPDLLSLGMPQGGGQSQSADQVKRFGQLFTKYLKDSVREVTLTVRWKRGKGTQSYSISTYWVNLNNAFPLSL